jgi:hypothetical protein
MLRKPITMDRLIYPGLELIMHGIIASQIGITARDTDVCFKVEICHVEWAVERLYWYPRACGRGEVLTFISFGNRTFMLFH